MLDLYRPVLLRIDTGLHGTSYDTIYGHPCYISGNSKSSLSSLHDGRQQYHPSHSLCCCLQYTTMSLQRLQHDILHGQVPSSSSTICLKAVQFLISFGLHGHLLFNEEMTLLVGCITVTTLDFLVTFHCHLVARIQNVTPTEKHCMFSRKGSLVHYLTAEMHQN